MILKNYHLKIIKGGCEMAKLTKNIVQNLNKQLEFMGCGWHYELSDENTYAPKARRMVNEGCKDFIYSSIINVTPTYMNWLVGWMKVNHNIDITFNNTAEIFWSKDYN